MKTNQLKIGVMLSYVSIIAQNIISNVKITGSK